MSQENKEITLDVEVADAQKRETDEKEAVEKNIMLAILPRYTIYGVITESGQTKIKIKSRG